MLLVVEMCCAGRDGEVQYVVIRKVRVCSAAGRARSTRHTIVYSTTMELFSLAKDESMVQV